MYGEGFYPFRCKFLYPYLQMPAIENESTLKTETLPDGFQISPYKPRLNHTKTIKSGKPFHTFFMYF